MEVLSANADAACEVARNGFVVLVETFNRGNAETVDADCRRVARSDVVSLGSEGVLAVFSDFDRGRARESRDLYIVARNAADCCRRAVLLKGERIVVVVGNSEGLTVNRFNVVEVTRDCAVVDAGDSSDFGVLTCNHVEGNFVVAFSYERIVMTREREATRSLGDDLRSTANVGDCRACVDIRNLRNGGSTFTGNRQFVIGVGYSDGLSIYAVNVVEVTRNIAVEVGNFGNLFGVVEREVDFSVVGCKFLTSLGEGERTGFVGLDGGCAARVVDSNRRAADFFKSRDAVFSIGADNFEVVLVAGDCEALTVDSGVVEVCIVRNNAAAQAFNAGDCAGGVKREFDNVVVFGREGFAAELSAEGECALLVGGDFGRAACVDNFRAAADIKDFFDARSCADNAEVIIIANNERCAVDCRQAAERTGEACAVCKIGNACDIGRAFVNEEVNAVRVVGCEALAAEEERTGFNRSDCRDVIRRNNRVAVFNTGE